MAKIIALTSEEDEISEQRKFELDKFRELISEEISQNGSTRINFICTHNSRRSQIAEVWMRTALKFNNINNIDVGSAGMQTTIFHPFALTALAKAGFQITIMEDGPNPRYLTSYGTDTDVIPLMYSKTIDEINNGQNYIAAMVCSDADHNCPFIPGMKRFSLNYDDPGIYDHTPNQTMAYDNKIDEIGREILHLVKFLKK